MLATQMVATHLAAMTALRRLKSSENVAQHPGSEDVNATLAAITGIEACDEVEGMLATQMVATHLAAMTALRRLKSSENVAQQDRANEEIRRSDLIDAPKSLMDRTLRCGARTRSGHPCRTPPVRGRRRC